MVDDRTQAPVATRVMSGLVEKIATGVYPVGSVLPSCRKLATELGVNKNTVTRAFGMLKESGLVKALPGEGMLVLKRPSVDRKDARRKTVALLNEVLYQSRVMGIGAEQVRAIFEECLAEWYKSAQLSMALVECNQYDAVSLANHIRRELGLPVSTVLLPDFEAAPDSYVQRHDLVITTFYHLAEVRAVLRPDDHSRVVVLQDRPSIKSLLALSEIPKGKTGIVAGHERTVQALERVLKEAGRDASDWAILDDPDRVRYLLSSYDTVVVSARCLTDLNKYAPTARIVTVIFEVDGQSMDYLRTTVSHMIELNSKTLSCV